MAKTYNLNTVHLRRRRCCCAAQHPRHSRLHTPHTLKLQPDRIDVPTISGYGPGWVAVNGERTTQSLLMSARGLRQAWPCEQFEALDASHFAMLAALDAELIVFGSGSRLRFVPTAWLAPLMARRVGFETMDTQAACRTYNILAGEGRHVLAALLLENPTPVSANC